MTGALKFLIKEMTIQTYYSKPEPTYNTAQVHGSLGRSSKRQPTRKEEALFFTQNEVYRHQSTIMEDFLENDAV